ALLAVVYYEQDRVGVHDADQYHESDMSQRDEAAAFHPKGHRGSDHRERNAEQDRERMEERLELGGEDHVHEEDREHECKGEVAEATSHLLVLAADLDAAAGRRLQLRDRAPRRRDGLRQSAIADIRVDG